MCSIMVAKAMGMIVMMEVTARPPSMPLVKRLRAVSSHTMGRPTQGAAAMAAGVYVAYEPAHIVLSVPPGGESYSLSFLDARDENMAVKSEVKL